MTIQIEVSRYATSGDAALALLNADAVLSLLRIGAGDMSAADRLAWKQDVGAFLDASRGGNLCGITEDHRYEMVRALNASRRIARLMEAEGIPQCADQVCRPPWLIHPPNNIGAGASPNPSP